MAIALLGSRCNAPSVMLANLIATPIELRWVFEVSNKIYPFWIKGSFLALPTRIWFRTTYWLHDCFWSSLVYWLQHINLSLAVIFFLMIPHIKHLKTEQIAHVNSSRSWVWLCLSAWWYFEQNAIRFVSLVFRVVREMHILDNTGFLLILQVQFIGYFHSDFFMFKPKLS